MMRWLTIVSVMAALALTCAATSRAQQNRAAPTAESGLKGLVRVHARSISSDESRFSGRGYAVSYEFSAGESMSFLVTAGRTDRERSDVCSTGSSGPLSFVAPELQANVARQEAGALYAWHVDIRMVEVHATTMTFDVSWQRTSHVPDERIEKTQFSQRLVLRQDESRVIDLIRAAPSRISLGLGDVDCLGVMIVVEGGIAEDPSLQGKSIEWDLWANIGSATSPHQKLRSIQGGVAEFAFEPIAVPGSADNRREWLFGTVTGRVLLDGSIDVAMNVSVGYVKKILSQAELIALFNTQQQRGTAGFQKNFVVKPGEPVLIVMPGKIQPATPGPITGKPVIQPFQPGYDMSITVQARVH